ncbi:MAG: hypothetical protein UU93_C0011G0021 [Candidatus Amesbacteria bacterium GW2011_GWA2_42_12]|uniref:Uncharacterized protein n=1 Tax=Candidatus Amesbacteria bacterium GW2011_GWA2_42_12 TaxID=1618356 RepID=A0A0G0Y5M5_9BACT|nr:MAG: hypothetical protein UU93_C0011G0021 [Candidatus Amesbacteria bacterium GW2011_GWA2_42_12]
MLSQYDYLDIRIIYGYYLLVSLDFYQSEEYRQKQSSIARHNWSLGKYAALIKPLKMRQCKNPDCKRTFFVKSFDPREYCSQSCAAKITNKGKISSFQKRLKISVWMSINNPSKGKPRVYRIELKCQNPLCQKTFSVLPYLSKRRKYCSNACAMKVIGGQTTSPKASKGKPGIRSDIDPNICFYSTWEANIARVFNLIKLDWEYAPKIFDLGKHTYRPDFYLPEYKTYVEIKNFMNAYSLERDRLFREKFPTYHLEIISSPEYKCIEKDYKDLIENWE